MRLGGFLTGVAMSVTAGLVATMIAAYQFAGNSINLVLAAVTVVLLILIAYLNGLFSRKRNEAPGPLVDKPPLDGSAEPRQPDAEVNSELGSSVFRPDETIDQATGEYPHHDLFGSDQVRVARRVAKIDDAALKGLQQPQAAQHSGSEAGPGLVILASVLCILWVVPAFIFLMVSIPDDKVRAVQLAVFLVSLGGGLAYFPRARAQLPTMADRITYFTGVCLGPVTLVALLL